MTINHALKRISFCRWWRKGALIIKKSKKILLNKKQFLYSDEKLFTVDGGINKKNVKIYAYSREEADEKGGNLKNYLFIFE